MTFIEWVTGLFKPREVVRQDPRVVDRRATASREHIGGVRPWSAVTGITLHQTACLLGEKPKRWDTLGAHIGITRAGQVIWLHDFTRVVWHGNAWNAGTVGVEIEGRFAGVDGRPDTAWNGAADTLPEVQAEAARGAIRWICSEVAKNGGAIKALVAHRQSSATRRSDPGQLVWQQVALPMHLELGLSDGGVGFKLNDGRAIPAEWDERCKKIPY